VLRINQLENILHRGNFGLISAEKSDRSDDKNKWNTMELGRALTSWGMRWYRTVGKYGGSVERSFLVLMPNEKGLITLGNLYDQTSVIVGSRGLAREIECRTGVTLTIFEGYKTVGPEASDNYTEIELADGKFALFSLVPRKEAK